MSLVQCIDTVGNNHVTIIKFNGSLRICIDHHNLNQAIQQEHYTMQTIEELTTQIPGATYFSVLDASSGYWQISLDQESAKLCTYSTAHLVATSSNAFRLVIICTRYFPKSDDRKVQPYWWCRGCDRWHSCMGNSRLIKVIGRAGLWNLKLNKTKCQFKNQEIANLGHVLIENGLKPDPKKTQAINDMTPPTSDEALQHFLGMITYQCKFIPNLSQTAAPLRALLEKDTEW